MSIKFDSGDHDGADYLEKSSPTVTGYPVTFACWVKPDSVSDWDGCISIAQSSVNNQHISLTLRSNGSVRAETRAVSFANSVGGNYSAGVWQHVAGVFATSSSRLAYLDGVAGTENTTDLTPSGVDMLRIGQSASTAARPMDGLLAECAIWNVALSADDISQLYDGYTAINIKPESLVSYYPLVRDYQEHMGNNSVTPNNTVVYDDHPPVFDNVPSPVVGAWGGL